MNEKMKIDGFTLRESSIKEGTDPQKSFTFPFMTDAPCHNWFGPPESCLCEEENVDLTRFQNSVMPVLFNHDRDKVIGRVDSIDFSQNGQARATVTLGGSDDAEKVIKAIGFGSVKGISVGYRRLNTVDVPKGATYKGVTYDEETYVTDRWMPVEISIVSCPADPECGIGRGFNNGGEKITVKVFSGGKRMNEEEKKTPAPAPAAVPPVKQGPDATAVKEAAEKAAKAEHERTMSIISLCDQFGVGKAEREAMLSNTAVTVEDARRQVLDILAKRNQPTANVGGDMHVGEDDKEKFVKKAADGLAIQYRLFDGTDKKPVDGAEEYAGCSLRAIAEDCLVDYGETSATAARHMSASNMFEELFAKRAMGSEQFASIIDSFGNKTMLKAYTEHVPVFRQLVSRGTNPDFKPTRKYRIGVDNEPELMAPESDEFKYGEMSDEYISTSIHTYGKAIGFTREIFINDDMGTVVAAIRRQSGGFVRAQEKMFFEMLAKSVPFDKKHGNLGAKGTIDIAGYNEIRNLMTHQMDSESKTYVGVSPRYILASDLYANDHLAILHSTSNPEQSNPGVVNPMQNAMTLVVSPYVEGKTYYAIADPSVMEGIEFTTLRGSDSPSSRTVIPSGHLGIDYQFWMDWGFNLIDYRAFAKQVVAD